MTEPSNRGKTLLTCPACHKKFWRFNAHIRNTTHACSRLCSDLIRPTRPRRMVTATCKLCGKVFSRRKGVGNPMKYCSDSCLGKAVWAMRVARGEKHPCPITSGPDNHNWRGGVSVRSNETRRATRAAVRKAKCCSKCGATGRLQAHHVETHENAPERRADPTNLIALCIDCHAEEHPRTAGLLRSRLR
jgi:5-methylcytosine-specific restriction endonuclease McrA